ncbi:MAG: carboxypeptidase regulatory-like domain-containing protein [Bacteroidia bacterium]|nr:carboxypeptidase regulatory-like domain-containing protein [Bacteroidia bacterium]
MKKYLSIFIVITLIPLLFLLLVNNNDKNNNPEITKKNFPYLKNNSFYINDSAFYPIAINCVITMQANQTDVWASSYEGYTPNGKHRFLSKDSSLMELKSEMALIKKMGFNTIRIVRIGEINIENEQTKNISFGVKVRNEKDSTIMLWNEENYTKYFNALSELFSIADSAGLKMIFLTRMLVDVQTTEEHLKKLVTKFKNEKSILAYDFFNEPLYFDLEERDKEYVHQTVKRWNKIVKDIAPYQLTTIGLAGIREIFEWDPNVLDVDFISLHPYEYEPEQVRNEFYWYGKYIKKPWIVGETAISADNDSISYESQKQFAIKTINQAYNCGAAGYSWWQYKDVDWKLFHANFMGVLNWNGETSVGEKMIPVKGSIKPVAEVFQSFNSSKKKEECICFDNYYNYSNGDKCRIIGKLIDEKGNPIEGGLVLAWNEWWSSSYHTISKQDGSFELLGTFPFYHWMASATYKSRVRGELKPDTAKTNTHKIPTMNIGNINLNKLKF